MSLSYQPVWRLSDLGSAPRDLRRGVQQLLAFLMRPGENERPWCSWLQLATDKDTLWFSLEHPASSGNFPTTITQAKNLFLHQYQQFASRDGHDNGYLCSLILMLTTVYDHENAEHTLQTARESLLEEGIMAAFLGPQSQLITLKRNRTGYPYRASNQFLTLRFAIQEDKMFVLPNRRLCVLLERHIQLHKGAW